MRALREGLAAVGTGIGPLACVRALVSCQLRPVAEAFATLSADVGCWWPRPGRGPRRRCRLGWGQLGRGPAGDVIVIHDEDVHWVLMTGHLLVLRIQWPRRPSFFSKLHIWVPGILWNCGESLSPEVAEVDKLCSWKQPCHSVCGISLSVEETNEIV